MELYFNKLIIKQLNKDYQTIRTSKDLPYDLKTLKFTRFYKELENVFEIQLFDDCLDQIEDRLKDDYTFYSNDTHIIFRDNFYDFKSCYRVLKTFKEQFEYPVIDYNAGDLEKLTKIIIHSFDDRIQYLNIKYQELFLSYENDELIKIISKDSKVAMDLKSDFTSIIEMMCKYNIQFFNFKNKHQNSNNPSDALREFLIDGYKVMTNFRMILKIYFKFMIINNYTDQNMVNYSATYLEK